MKTKLKIIALFIFTLYIFSIFTLHGITQTRIETAGKKFKSIRVLNDMPADQMGKVMNMMSASLGVDCKFCHVSNNGDFEKEGVENKDIARNMLKMTFELNKNYFEGRPEINCNTCHQGKARPSPSFPLKPATQEKLPKQPARKPTVDEILAKYEIALGGKANLAKITTRKIKARRIEPDGKTFEDEEILQKGTKLSIRTTYPSKQYGNYVIKEIFDGKNAFKLGNGAKIDLKPDEIEQIKREAQLFANPNLRSIYQKMDFQAVEKIEGREVYLVIGSVSETQRENLYFDISTGLLVRRTASTPTILGNFVYQIDYTVYKDFGGVKLPTLINFAVPNIHWTRRILEVKNNVAIVDADFGMNNLDDE